MPEPAEVQSYLLGESTARRLATYRQLAQAVLDGRGPDVPGAVPGAPQRRAEAGRVAQAPPPRIGIARGRSNVQMSSRAIVGALRRPHRAGRAALAPAERRPPAAANAREVMARHRHRQSSAPRQPLDVELGRRRPLVGTCDVGAREADVVELVVAEAGQRRIPRPEPSPEAPAAAGSSSAARGTARRIARAARPAAAPPVRYRACSMGSPIRRLASPHRQGETCRGSTPTSNEEV